ncbi:DUF2200 family protein [Erythrobacter arachoides]|uniref:DUF2200 family protein n=1 Tax=Aurantiacibacter arachoides TaxID=1850444 RepID=A0A845A178_9SPHN|nr:DUF2200 domain-containing protein [Aurantiacibacter arachoides]MXO93310.1 DUF2200 family protein [Aurantiacibacter arachoides]
MAGHRIFAMPFAKVYPAYVAKAERKGRTRQEVDAIIRWQTGYEEAGLAAALADGRDFTAFYAQAPAMNPDRMLVTGRVCGVQVEAVNDPLMREIRVLDKLVDELAKGRAMEKILRRA